MYGTHFIHRKNIHEFMKSITRIDDGFNWDKPLRQKIQVLTKLVQGDLHMITKYNYHREELAERSFLQKAGNPVKHLKNLIDFHFFWRNIVNYYGLYSDANRFGRALYIH